MGLFNRLSKYIRFNNMDTKKIKINYKMEHVLFFSFFWLGSFDLVCCELGELLVAPTWFDCWWPFDLLVALPFDRLLFVCLLFCLLVLLWLFWPPFEDEPSSLFFRYFAIVPSRSAIENLSFGFRYGSCWNIESFTGVKCSHFLQIY